MTLKRKRRYFDGIQNPYWYKWGEMGKGASMCVSETKENNGSLQTTSSTLTYSSISELVFIISWIIQASAFHNQEMGPYEIVENVDTNDKIKAKSQVWHKTRLPNLGQVSNELFSSLRTILDSITSNNSNICHFVLK